jgi:hypothetical protein
MGSSRALCATHARFGFAVIALRPASRRAPGIRTAAPIGGDVPNYEVAPRPMTK